MLVNKDIFFKLLLNRSDEFQDLAHSTSQEFQDVFES